MRYLKFFVFSLFALTMVSSSVCAQTSSVKVAHGWSVNPDETLATQEAVAMMKKSIEKPDLIVLLAESSYEKDNVIAKELRKSTKAKIFGLEGSYAVFSTDGVHVGEKGSLAILGIQAPSWDIGVAAIDMSTKTTPLDIKAAAEKAIKSAVSDAKRKIDEKPNMILLAPTKGKEEPILEAIEYIFGRDVKVTGGSPGSPVVTVNDRIVVNGFAVAVIYADTKIGSGFHAGISVNRNKTGVITALGDTPRILKEINNRPAFDVYNEWTEGGLSDIDPRDTPKIWAKEYAMVRVYNLADGTIGEKVVVPIQVNPDKSMLLGANAREGESIYFANINKTAYIKRAGTIVKQALVDGKITYSELAGGIHVYCRGAAFSQFGKDKDELQLIVDECNKAMKNKPYIGTFTAGEQGNIAGYGCFMGNLTSAMVLFGEK